MDYPVDEHSSFYQGFYALIHQGNRMRPGVRNNSNSISQKQQKRYFNLSLQPSR